MHAAHLISLRPIPTNCCIHFVDSDRFIKPQKMTTSKNTVARVDQEPGSFRKVYHRCRRYCILTWYWLTSRKIESGSLPERPTIPDKLKTSQNDQDKVEHVLERETPQKSSSSIPPVSTKETIDMLFVGLDSSGISTTANNLFHDVTDIGKTRAEELDIVEINQSVDFSDKQLQLRVIDVPGFCKGRAVEEDAEMVLALNSYLKSLLPNKIPDSTFIMSRFDDNRFAGEGSEFSKMLLALSHSQLHWTDNQCSNVVLVLTHGAKVQREEIPERITQFQNTFHDIFPKSPEVKAVSCVVIDNCNTTSREELEFADILFTQHCPPSIRNSQNLKQYIHQLKNSEFATKNNCNIQRTPVANLQNPNRRNVNELLDILLQRIPYKTPNHIISEDTRSLSVFVPYFPSLKPSPEAENHNVTKLVPEMELLLGDGVTRLPVSQIVVGNKLFNKEMNHVVVTRINRIICVAPCSQVGIHFYRRPGYDYENATTVFKYSGKSRLRSEALDWERILLPKVKSLNELTLYEIQVNNGVCAEDTFIVDGYVVIAAVEPNESFL